MIFGGFATRQRANVATMLLPVVVVLAQNDHKGSDLNKAFNDHKGATTTTDVAYADHHERLGLAVGARAEERRHHLRVAVHARHVNCAVPLGGLRLHERRLVRRHQHPLHEHVVPR